MKELIQLIFLLASLHLASVNAKVLDQSPASFVIEIKVATDQPVDVTYQQFLKVGEWWDGEHSWFGKSANLYLEPKVGGCFCEVDGDRQAQHMIVSYIEPNKEVRMLGGLGPLQMMGVNGAMSWTFTPAEHRTTVIVYRYTVSGYHKEGLDTLAPIVDRVQTGQLNRLVTSLKRSEN